jgi:hypothetical protein
MQPLGSFPAFYGSQNFIIEFTRTLHLYLYWVRLIQSTLSNPISKRSILVLSSHSNFFPIRATCNADLNLLDFTILIILGKENKSYSSSMQLPPPSRHIFPPRCKHSHQPVLKHHQFILFSVDNRADSCNAGYPIFCSSLTTRDRPY